MMARVILRVLTLFVNLFLFTKTPKISYIFEKKKETNLVISFRKQKAILRKVCEEKKKR